VVSLLHHPLQPEVSAVPTGLGMIIRRSIE